MKKLIVLIAFVTHFLFFVNNLFSKDSTKMSAGIEAGVQLPITDLSERAGLGYGFSATFNYEFKPNILAIVSVGYYGWPSKDKNVVAWESGYSVGDYNFSYSTIPVLAGIQYNIHAGPVIPYFGGEIGAHFNGFSVKSLSDGKTSSTRYVNFGVAPFIGIMYPLNNQISLKANIKYNFIYRGVDEGIAFVDKLVSNNLMYFGFNLGCEYNF